jgi:4-hydroxy-tetrahydrodipicolinate reductase
MLKAIVAGAAGRMGKRIIHAIHQHPGIQLGGAFEHPGHLVVGADAGVEAGVGALGIRIEASLEGAAGSSEVLIDFTTPDATLQNIRWAAKRDLPMVIGTTGFSGDTLKEVK